MLDRLQRVITGGGGLLRAEAALAAHTLRRVLAATLVIAVALALAGVALIVLAVAGTALLAREMGWAPAAAIVAGGILLLSLITAGIAKLSMPRGAEGSPEMARLDAERHKREMRDAVTLEDDPMTDSSTQKPTDWKDKATEFVAEHPVEVASAAFAVLALVGPFRTFRLVSRGAAVAGLVGSLLQHTGASSNGAATHVHGSRTPRPAPPPPPGTDAPPQARTPADLG